MLLLLRLGETSKRRSTTSPCKALSVPRIGFMMMKRRLRGIRFFRSKQLHQLKVKGLACFGGPFYFKTFESCCLVEQTMWVEHELLCHTGVEGLVALGCIVERDDGCIDDLCDGKPVVQDGLHELAVVLEDGRLAGVEAVRFCPAETQTHA